MKNKEFNIMKKRFLAALLCLCLLVGLFSLEYYRQQSSLNSIFQFTMFIQPLLLTGISTLACIIGKHQGVWEMSAVCKYNDKYLLAFRMLCMGFLGMASTVFTLLSVKNEGGIIFFKAFYNHFYNLRIKRIIL